MKRRTGRLTNAFTLAASLALTCLLAEFGARVYLARFAGPEAFRRYASVGQLDAAGALDGGPARKYRPHRYLGYMPTPGYSQGGARHNALGYRGPDIAVPKPEGLVRILCAGGSTTYTPMVGDEETYPAQLERALRERGVGPVEVVNAGVEGWLSYETLINLELRALELEPDVVVVYHGVNDLLARLVWPPEAYRGDNSGYRRAVVPMRPPALWEQSTLLRIIAIRRGAIEPPGAMTRTLDRLLAEYKGHAFAQQAREGAYPSGFFAEVPVRRMLGANPPRYFERNLRAIAALCAARGVALALATFACARDYPGQPLTCEPEFLAGLDEMNAAIRRVGADTEAHLYDFAAAFPGDRALYVDGVHLNAEGAALKGELFAGYLMEARLLDQRRGE
jgi:lysophospholipase L1-like esterase